MSPGNRQWSSEPFKAYTRNLTKVGELMRGDGWARCEDGVRAKGGQRAVVEISTATGNTRRELTEQMEGGGLRRDDPQRSLHRAQR